MKKITLIAKFTMIAMFLASINVYASSDMSSQLKEKIQNSVVLYIGQSKAYVNAEEKQIDEGNSDVIPVIKDGRTLVLVRFISESLGAEVDYNSQSKTIDVSYGQDTIGLVIGSNIMTYSHKSFDNVSQQDVITSDDTKLEVSAQIINDRTFVPLRALVEALGKDVFWDDRGLIVISDTNNMLDATNDKDLVDELVKNYIGLDEFQNVEYSVKNGYLTVFGKKIYYLRERKIDDDGGYQVNGPPPDNPRIVKKVSNTEIYLIKAKPDVCLSHGFCTYIITDVDKQIEIEDYDSDFFGFSPKNKIEPNAWLFMDKYIFLQFQSVSQGDIEKGTVHTAEMLDILNLESGNCVNINDLINKENILKFDISKNEIIIKANDDISDTEDKYDETKYETKELDLSELLKKL